MYVVIIGLGEVGRHVIRMLEMERHEVVAIDTSPEAIAYVDEHHDVMTLRGYGANSRVLEQANVARADLVAAVTDHDEVNLIAALAAKQAGAKRAIARVQGAEWAMGVEGVQYGLLGVDVVINPLVLVAQELAKIARSHGALEVIDLANDHVEIVQMELGDHGRMLHKPLARLPLPPHTLVAAVVRDGELFVPGGADVLLPGDRIFLLGRTHHMVEAEDLFTHRREAQRVCIFGGGVVGEALARILSREGTQVLLIESDPVLARALAERLAQVTVVHGDGTDLQLMLEEEVGTYDLFAAASGDDEDNLMAALLARRAGAARTASLVQRPGYMEIYRQLGVDIVLSPRVVASDHILRYSRQTELRSLTVLEEGQAEVLELVAAEGSRAVGVPVRGMDLPRGALLAAILHGDDVVIPRGDDTIRAGDTVVVLTTTAARPAVARIFRPRVL